MPGIGGRRPRRCDGHRSRVPIRDRRAVRPWYPARAARAVEHRGVRPHRRESVPLSVSVAPLSTFSVDVDRASYSNVRRFLNQGTLPPKDAVRIEELVNYFPYGDADALVAGRAAAHHDRGVAAAPWNPRHDLVRIALRARDVDMRRAPASQPRLPRRRVRLDAGPGPAAARQAVARAARATSCARRITSRSSSTPARAGLVLPSTPGSDKQRILAALDGLEAGGSTAGGAGIRLAYDVARQNFIRGGNNRVILCTDGDFNVGASSDAALVELIEQRRTEGAFLTILGFGMGNYKDAKMEKLSGAGNGNYGYIDDLLEARKMLVQGDGRHARHRREGREAAGGVQSGARAGVPAARLRGSPAA